MIIQAYLTDGFFPWAEFWLESLRHFHPNIPVILSTRNLTNEQIAQLESVNNVTVQNEELTYAKLAKLANLDINKMMDFKKQVETVHVTNENKIWKLMISADDRVKSVYKVLKQVRDQTDFLMHIDIDMYFRKPLHDLFDIITAHVVSMRFRLHSKENRKVLGSLQGFKLCDKTFKFMETWIKYIDNVKPVNRPLGYGQTSCYYAYRELINEIKWGKIPPKFATAQMPDHGVIWAANTLKGKTENLRLFREDFNLIK